MYNLYQSRLKQVSYLCRFHDLLIMSEHFIHIIPNLQLSYKEKEGHNQVIWHESIASFEQY